MQFKTMVFVSRWSSLCVQLWYGVLDLLSVTLKNFSSSFESLFFLIKALMVCKFGEDGREMFTFVGFGTTWSRWRLLDL